MRTQLEYRGSFRYVDQRAVELAIGEAAEHLDDDGISNVDRDWMRFVRCNGTTVHVDARLPTMSDRYVATGRRRPTTP